MIPFFGILIFFLLITSSLILILYDNTLFSKLKREIWFKTESIIYFNIALSFLLLSISVISDFMFDLYLIPLLLLIFMLEFIWILCIYSRNFYLSNFISVLIFISIVMNSILLCLKSNPELSIITFPVLFTSVLQICISDSLYYNNIDNTDLCK